MRRISFAVAAVALLAASPARADNPPLPAIKAAKVDADDVFAIIGVRAWKFTVNAPPAAAQYDISLQLWRDGKFSTHLAGVKQSMKPGDRFSLLVAVRHLDQGLTDADKVTVMVRVSGPRGTGATDKQIANPFKGHNTLGGTRPESIKAPNTLLIGTRKDGSVAEQLEFNDIAIVLSITVVETK